MVTPDIARTSEYILNLAKKIGKETKSFYYTSPIETESTDGNSTNDGTQIQQYTDAVNRVKKNNITTNNIGEMMLMQIPSVSSEIAKLVMAHHHTIERLINALHVDSHCLDDIKRTTKTGKTMKISSSSIKNIVEFLLQ